MGDAVENRDVGTRPQRQVDIGAAMRAFDGFGTARIDDDEFRTLTDAPLHQRAENGMTLGRICTDDHDDVCLQDGIEMLTRSTGTHRGSQSELCRRVTNASTVVDVVVTENSAHEFRRKEDLFVSTARTRDSTD